MYFSRDIKTRQTILRFDIGHNHKLDVSVSFQQGYVNPVRSTIKLPIGEPPIRPNIINIESTANKQILPGEVDGEYI